MFKDSYLHTSCVTKFQLSACLLYFRKLIKQHAGLLKENENQSEIITPLGLIKSFRLQNKTKKNKFK